MFKQHQITDLPLKEGAYFKAGGNHLYRTRNRLVLVSRRRAGRSGTVVMNPLLGQVQLSAGQLWLRINPENPNVHILTRGQSLI